MTEHARTDDGAESGVPPLIHRHAPSADEGGTAHRTSGTAGAVVTVVELRRLTRRDDLSAVQALLASYAAAVAERARREYGLDLAELAPGADLLTEIESLLDAPNVLYVAELDGEASATGALRHLGEGVGEIKRMYVEPAARRRGVGRAVLSALVADAHRAGLRRLRLETAPWMAEAHALYASAGFVDQDPYAGREFDGIAAVDGIARFMELRLPRPEPL